MAKTVTTEHVGEFQVVLTADSLEDLFSELVRVIAREAGIRWDIKSRGPEVDDEAKPNNLDHVSVSARDCATLLADWANEVLGRSEATGRVYCEIRDVRVTMGQGTCTISAMLRSTRPKRTSPLKAATYHKLALERFDQAWRAVILFDV